MRQLVSFVILSGMILGLVGCTTPAKEPVVPEPVPTPPVVEKVVVPPKPAQKQKPIKTHSLGIIGEVEPIYFLPMKSAFLARIDTGAKSSSIDVTDLHEFEREGEKWVSFYLVNRKTKEQHLFEKRLQRQVKIKREGSSEARLVVLMTVRFGKEKLTVPFSLADRSKFDYQALVGRNILQGRAIVDINRSMTLY